MKRLILCIIILVLFNSASCVQINFDRDIESDNMNTEDNQNDSNGKYYLFRMRSDNIDTYDPEVEEALNIYLDYRDGIMTGFDFRNRDEFRELFYWESEYSARLYYFLCKPYYMNEVWKQAYGPIKTYISIPYIKEMIVEEDGALVKVDYAYQLDYKNDPLDDGQYPQGILFYSFELAKVNGKWLISNIITDDFMDRLYADEGIDLMDRFLEQP